MKADSSKNRRKRGWINYKAHGHQQLTQALDQEGADVGPGWPEVLAVVVRDESVQLHQLVDRQYAVAQVPALSPRLVVGRVGQHRLVANMRRVLYSPVDLLAQGLQGAWSSIARQCKSFYSRINLIPRTPFLMYCASRRYYKDKADSINLGGDPDTELFAFFGSDHSNEKI